MNSRLLILSANSGLGDEIRERLSGRFEVVTALPDCADVALAADQYDVAIIHVTREMLADQRHDVIEKLKCVSRPMAIFAVGDAEHSQADAELGNVVCEWISMPLNFDYLQRRLETSILESGISASTREEFGPESAKPLTLEQRVNAAEREIIDESLRRHNFRRTETARELGISRVTLYNKMKKFGMLH